MQDTIEKLKLQLIEQLNLEDVTPEEIKPDEPLFGTDLGLDSIDALEIIVLLEREYGIRIESQEAGKEIFKSLRSIAEFIEKNK